MTKATGHAAQVTLKWAQQEVEGCFVDIGGERYYKLSHYDAMPSFLMTLVSPSDHWLFISSNGGLTAGRRDPDHALFPYCNDDRIHDSQDQTGSKTVIRVRHNGDFSLWEPFSQRYEGVYSVTRNLYKSAVGNRIIFEEINADLGLTFAYEWMTGERFGFVRRASLRNQSNDPVRIELLDGIQNVLPAGVTRRFQMEYSTLVDGYKRTELECTSGAAFFRMSSIPVDRPEPSESLRVNIAWSIGLESATRLLSSKQLDRFRRGCPVTQETDVVGCRGTYFLGSSFQLHATEQRDWFIAADLNQDSADLKELLRAIKSEPDLCSAIGEDIRCGTRKLKQIVASSDGIQYTADELNTSRHFSNTLFNVMRGGLPDDGYRVRAEDFKRFLAKANTELASRHAGFIESLPETLLHSELIAKAQKENDIDLERIATEYLPLTFSRRHGDPSRPWNVFSIEVKNERKEKVLNYEGNWRDIFQNWEALSWSFPGYVESMITKFLNSSTADGYNPYRVMRDGYEWETVDPHDAWSYIGYWGDHQVVYLLRLLEQAKRFYPEALPAMLHRPLFTFANVPYRLKSYESILLDPRNTITFDADAHRAIMAHAAKLGADGKALFARDGKLVHATLTEKLLLVILSKLSNFVPGAGIWMNTQRPEWNDANNALVGSGASVVTLCYLRRFISFAKELFASANSSELSIAAELGNLLASISSALRERSDVSATLSDGGRKAMLDALGKAGSDYRQGLYGKGLSGATTSVAKRELISFCEVALQHIDHSIAANRRDDGLYHSYNLITVVGDEIRIRRLYEMLEGQVAVLSSGVLSIRESLAVLDALRSSSLYRSDQQGYLLYPDRELPKFLQKNNIPPGEIEKVPGFQQLLKSGDHSIVVRDCDGGVHFNADLRNEGLLRQALNELKERGGVYLTEKDERSLVEVYEKVFDHQSFTGRSGTFYKYEGLGCIYWHMVSKLLLAIGELQREYADAEPTLVKRLQQHYRAIREGLGSHKSPQVYGAIPIDPYSHTPKSGGAQQPGMTGQVKEDFISRFVEMGLSVERGQIWFLPQLLFEREFLAQPTQAQFFGVDGMEQSTPLSKESLAFTFCGTPIVVHRAGPQHIKIGLADGSSQKNEGLTLDPAVSNNIFDRNGIVNRLDVFLGRA